MLTVHFQISVFAHNARLALIAQFDNLMKWNFNWVSLFAGMEYGMEWWNGMVEWKM